MKHFDPTITKRVRRRRLQTRSVEQVRWFVNYHDHDPDTGNRKLPTFVTRREAEAFRADLMAKVHAGAYVDPSRAPDILQAVQHYLDNRPSEVKKSTLRGYRVVAKAITGPLLVGTPRQRVEYSLSGCCPIPMRCCCKCWDMS
ncbi:MAG: hypothetical protein GXP01_09035 [Alphaproteobacteria bacterium]|nr:hypothetical protein [Alphaproteobacteria bacterium]